MRAVHHCPLLQITDSEHDTDTDVGWDAIACALCAHAKRKLARDAASGVTGEKERAEALADLDRILTWAHQLGPRLSTAPVRLLELIVEGLNDDQRRFTQGSQLLRLLERHILPYPIYASRRAGRVDTGCVSYSSKASNRSALELVSDELAKRLLHCGFLPKHEAWAQQQSLALQASGSSSAKSRVSVPSNQPQPRDYLNCLAEWMACLPVTVDPVEQHQTQESGWLAAGSKPLLPVSRVCDAADKWLRAVVGPGNVDRLDPMVQALSIVADWCGDGVLVVTDPYTAQASAGGLAGEIAAAIADANGGVSSSPAGSSGEHLYGAAMTVNKATIDTLTGAMNLLSTLLIQRGRTAHLAFALGAGPLLSYLSFGNAWESFGGLSADKRAKAAAIRFLLLAIRITTSAYTSHRGDEAVFSASSSSSPSDHPTSVDDHSSASASWTSLPRHVRMDMTQLSSIEGQQHHNNDNSSHQGRYDIPALIHRGAASALPLHLTPFNSPAPCTVAAGLLGSHYMSHRRGATSSGTGDGGADHPASSSASADQSPLPSPRLHWAMPASSSGHIFPILLRLAPEVLKRDVVLEGLRQASTADSASAVNTSAMHGADLDAQPQPYSYLALAVECMYHTHAAAAAVAASTTSRFLPMPTDEIELDDAGAGGTSSAATGADGRILDQLYFGYQESVGRGSDTITLPFLLHHICGSHWEGSISSGTTASSQQRPVGAGAGKSGLRSEKFLPEYLDVLSALLMTHPDALPRGHITSCLISALTAELQHCKRRQDATILSVLKLLFVLVEVAAGDDAPSSLPATVCASATVIQALHPYLSVTGDGLLGSPMAHLSSNAKSLVARASADVTASAPRLHRAHDTYDRIGRLVDVTTVHSTIHAAVAQAVIAEAGAWTHCVDTLLRVVVPGAGSRKETKMGQHAIRLITRVLAMGRGRGAGKLSCSTAAEAASPSPIGDSIAASASASRPVCDTGSLLLLPSSSVPVPCVALTASLLTQCLSLPCYSYPASGSSSFIGVEAHASHGLWRTTASTSSDANGTGAVSGTGAPSSAEYQLLSMLLQSAAREPQLAGLGLLGPLSTITANGNAGLHSSAIQPIGNAVQGSLASSFDCYDDVVGDAQSWMDSIACVGRSSSIIPSTDSAGSAVQLPLPPPDQLGTAVTDLLSGGSSSSSSLLPRLALWLLLRLVSDWCGPQSKARVDAAESGSITLAAALRNVVGRLFTSSSGQPTVNQSISAIAGALPACRLLHWSHCFGGEGWLPTSILRDKHRTPQANHHHQWFTLWGSQSLPSHMPPLLCAKAEATSQCSRPAGVELPDGFIEREMPRRDLALGRLAAPAPQLLAMQALLLASFVRTACAVMGISSIPGVLDEPGLRSAIGVTNDGRVLPSLTSPAATTSTLDHPSAVAASAVASQSHCASALHLQRAVQLARVCASVAPAVPASTITIASWRALMSALTTFIGLHIGAVLENCVNGTSLPPPPAVTVGAGGADSAMDVDTNYDGGAPGAASSGASGSLENTGTVVRATAILHGIASLLRDLRGCRIGSSGTAAASDGVVGLFSQSGSPSPLMNAFATLGVAQLQSSCVRALQSEAVGGMAGAHGIPSITVVMKLPSSQAAATQLQQALTEAASMSDGDDGTDDAVSSGAAAGSKRGRDTRHDSQASGASTKRSASAAAGSFSASTAQQHARRRMSGGRSRRVIDDDDDESDDQVGSAGAGYDAAGASSGGGRGSKSPAAARMPIDEDDDDEDDFKVNVASSKGTSRRSARAGSLDDDDDEFGGTQGAGGSNADRNIYNDDEDDDGFDNVKIAGAGKAAGRGGGSGASKKVLDEVQKSLQMDALATALIDVVALSHPFASVLTQTEQNDSLNSGTGASVSLRQHSSRAPAAVLRHLAVICPYLSSGNNRAPTSKQRGLSLSEFLRFYCLLSPTALAPSCFSAAIAAVTVSQSGADRCAVATRAMAAITNRLAQIQAMSACAGGVASPVHVGWEMVAGRMALQACNTIIGLRGDSPAALLSHAGVTACEPGLAHDIYIALPHIERPSWESTIKTVFYDAADGQRRPCQFKDEEAVVLGCLYVPYGAEFTGAPPAAAAGTIAHAGRSSGDSSELLDDDVVELATQHDSAAVPMVTAATILMALIHHLQPHAGHVDPELLLADVITTAAMLVKHAPVDAYSTAMGTVADYYHGLYSAAYASTIDALYHTGKREADPSTLQHLCRRIFPFFPIADDNSVSHLIIRMGANATMYPSARAATANAMAVYGSAFATELFYSRNGKSDLVVPFQLEKLTLAFPGLHLPPVHAEGSAAVCGMGRDGWNALPSATASVAGTTGKPGGGSKALPVAGATARAAAGRASTQASQAASSSSSALIPPRSSSVPPSFPSPVTPFDRLLPTDGSSADRFATSMWTLAALVAWCGPESNYALLQLVLRSHDTHPCSILALRCLAVAATTLGFGGLSTGSAAASPARHGIDAAAAVSCLLHSRLQFLTEAWLRHALPWTAFPWRLMRHGSLKSFLQSHQRTVVAACVINAGLRRVGWCLRMIHDELGSDSSPLTSLMLRTGTDGDEDDAIDILDADDGSGEGAETAADFAKRQIVYLHECAQAASAMLPSGWPSSSFTAGSDTIDAQDIDATSFDGGVCEKLACTAADSAARSVAGTRKAVGGWAFASSAAGAAGGGSGQLLMSGDARRAVDGSCAELLALLRELRQEPAGEATRLDPLSASKTAASGQHSPLPDEDLQSCSSLVIDALPLIIATIAHLPSSVAPSSGDTSGPDDAQSAPARLHLNPLLCVSVMITATEVIAAAERPLEAAAAAATTGRKGKQSASVGGASAASSQVRVNSPSELLFLVLQRYASNAAAPARSLAALTALQLLPTPSLALTVLDGIHAIANASSNAYRFVSQALCIGVAVPSTGAASSASAGTATGWAPLVKLARPQVPILALRASLRQITARVMQAREMCERSSTSGECDGTELLASLKADAQAYSAALAQFLPVLTTAADPGSLDSEHIRQVMQLIIGIRSCSCGIMREWNARSYSTAVAVTVRSLCLNLKSPADSALVALCSSIAGCLQACSSPGTPQSQMVAVASAALQFCRDARALCAVLMQAALAASILFGGDNDSAVASNSVASIAAMMSALATWCTELQGSSLALSRTVMATLVACYNDVQTVVAAIEVLSARVDAMPEERASNNIAPSADSGMPVAAAMACLELPAPSSSTTSATSSFDRNLAKARHLRALSTSLVAIIDVPSLQAAFSPQGVASAGTAGASTSLVSAIWSACDSLHGTATSTGSAPAYVSMALARLSHELASALHPIQPQPPTRYVSVPIDPAVADLALLQLLPYQMGSRLRDAAPVALLCRLLGELTAETHANATLQQLARQCVHKLQLLVGGVDADKSHELGILMDGWGNVHGHTHPLLLPLQAHVQSITTQVAVGAATGSRSEHKVEVHLEKYSFEGRRQGIAALGPDAGAYYPARPVWEVAVLPACLLSSSAAAVVLLACDAATGKPPPWFAGIGYVPSVPLHAPYSYAHARVLGLLAELLSAHADESGSADAGAAMKITANFASPDIVPLRSVSGDWDSVLPILNSSSSAQASMHARLCAVAQSILHTESGHAAYQCLPSRYRNILEPWLPRAASSPINEAGAASAGLEDRDLFYHDDAAMSAVGGLNTHNASSSITASVAGGQLLSYSEALRPVLSYGCAGSSVPAADAAQSASAPPAVQERASSEALPTGLMVWSTLGTCGDVIMRIVATDLLPHLPPRVATFLANQLLPVSVSLSLLHASDRLQAASTAGGDYDDDDEWHGAGAGAGSGGSHIAAPDFSAVRADKSAITGEGGTGADAGSSILSWARLQERLASRHAVASTGRSLQGSATPDSSFAGSRGGNNRSADVSPSGGLIPSPPPSNPGAAAQPQALVSSSLHAARLAASAETTGIRAALSRFLYRPTDTTSARSTPASCGTPITFRRSHAPSNPIVSVLHFLRMQRWACNRACIDAHGGAVINGIHRDVWPGYAAVLGNAALHGSKIGAAIGGAAASSVSPHVQSLALSLDCFTFKSATEQATMEVQGGQRTMVSFTSVYTVWAACPEETSAVSAIARLLVAAYPANSQEQMPRAGGLRGRSVSKSNARGASAARGSSSARPSGAGVDPSASQKQLLRAPLPLGMLSGHEVALQLSLDIDYSLLAAELLASTCGMDADAVDAVATTSEADAATALALAEAYITDRHGVPSLEAVDPAWFGFSILPPGIDAVLPMVTGNTAGAAAGVTISQHDAVTTGITGGHPGSNVAPTPHALLLSLCAYPSPLAALDPDAAPGIGGQSGLGLLSEFGYGANASPATASLSGLPSASSSSSLSDALSVVRRLAGHRGDWAAGLVLGQSSTAHARQQHNTGNNQRDSGWGAFDSAYLSDRLSSSSSSASADMMMLAGQYSSTTPGGLVVRCVDVDAGVSALSSRHIIGSQRAGAAAAFLGDGAASSSSVDTDVSTHLPLLRLRLAHIGSTSGSASGRHRSPIIAPLAAASSKPLLEELTASVAKAATVDADDGILMDFAALGVLSSPNYVRSASSFDGLVHAASSLSTLVPSRSQRVAPITTLRSLATSASLHRAKQLRTSARLPHALIELQRLSGLFDGRGVSTAVSHEPVAAPRSNAGAGTSLGATALDAVFSTCSSLSDSGLVKSERARLAWSMNDPTAALSLMHSAMCDLAAALGIVLQHLRTTAAAAAAPRPHMQPASSAGAGAGRKAQQQAVLPPLVVNALLIDEPTAMWAQLTCATLVAHLSGCLIAAAGWLSASGLDRDGDSSADASAASSGASGSASDAAESNPFAVLPSPTSAATFSGVSAASAGSAAGDQTGVFAAAFATLESALGLLCAHVLRKDLITMLQNLRADASRGGVGSTTSTAASASTHSCRMHLLAASALTAALPDAPTTPTGASSASVPAGPVQAASAAARAALTHRAAAPLVSRHDPMLLRHALQSRAHLALAKHADGYFTQIESMRTSASGQDAARQLALKEQHLLEMDAKYQRYMSLVQTSRRLDAENRKAEANAKRAEATKALGDGIDPNAMHHYLRESRFGLQEDQKADRAQQKSMVLHRSMAIKNYCAYLRTRPKATSASGSRAGVDGGGVGGASAAAEMQTVFRLVSLWFDKCNDPAVCDLMGRELASVPPSSLLVALPQIASRLGPDPGYDCTLPVFHFSKPAPPQVAQNRSGKAGAQPPPSAGVADASLKAAQSSARADLRNALQHLNQWAASRQAWSFAGGLEFCLLRMLIAAPHRTALQLLALEKGRRVYRPSRKEGAEGGSTGKIDAARRILSRAAGLSARMRHLVTSMRLMTDVYVSIAMRPTDGKTDRGRKVGLDKILIGRGIGAWKEPSASTSSSMAAGAAAAAGQPSPAAAGGGGDGWTTDDAWDRRYHGVSIARFQDGKSGATDASSGPAVSADVVAGIFQDMPVVTDGYMYGPASVVEPGAFVGGGDGPAAGAAPASTIDPYALPVHLLSFGSGYTHPASGISCPKLLQCPANDGRVYRQLIKGGFHPEKSNIDDMRQDAAVETLFGCINTLVDSDAGASARKLRMSTYRVVVLGPTCGLLEWVEGVMSQGGYIDDAPFNGHARHRPGEWDRSQCRKHLEDAVGRLKVMQKEVADAVARNDPNAAALAARPDPRVPALTHIFRQHTACFHHFFSDLFPHPSDALAARLNYTRSTAVSSVVCHIAGISDRHYNNILVMIRTGKVLHIDFGLVFEQGKLLPTPEMVPFRLTRDTVAGFGVYGTKGCFTASMEHSLRVLRNNTSTIMAVFSVVLHDPLFRWALTPQKAVELSRQRERDVSVAPGGAAGGAAADAFAYSQQDALIPSTQGNNTARDRSVSTARQLPPPSQHTGFVNGDDGGSGDAGIGGGGGGGADGSSAQTEHDMSALRVMRRVHAKLVGLEFSAGGDTAAASSSLSSSVGAASQPGHGGGGFSGLPVRSQAVRMIEAAQDFSAMAKMFSGWTQWC